MLERCWPWLARFCANWRAEQPHRGSLTLFRRYLRAACWWGNALFLVVGALVGYAYGVASGRGFFADLYPVNQAGSLAADLGITSGVLLGLLAQWVVCVVLCVMLGALAYCFKFKGLPLPK